MSEIQEQYEHRWINRLKREPNEQFDHYERNLVLPPLFKKNENVLDLASGNSIVGEYLQKKYQCNVIAIDFSKKAIENAKKRGLKGVVSSVEGELPFATNTFDLVFWGDNIEHVFHPEKVLKEIRRILKKNGRLIISTPNQAYWRYRLHSFIKGSLPKTEGENNKPWEWGHIRFFTKEIITDLLKISGFKIKKFVGVSRRRPDKYLLKIAPELFGMIMVVEAQKI